MDEKEFRKIMITIVILGLLVLTFIILRPIAISIFLGLVLSYLFHPIYKKVKSKVKSKNLATFIIIAGLLIVIFLPIVLLFPIITRQIFNAYVAMKGLDLSPGLMKIMPSLFDDPQIAADTIAMITTFTANIADIFLSTFQTMIFNLPKILLHSAIVLFTFFFTLRDQEKFREYFISISPFPSEYQKKFSEKFGQVTSSVLYGQIVVGLAQGIIAGIGYFVFGVPNALLLTVMTVLVGVIPIIGPWLVWVPVDIYLFLSGSTGAAIGLLIYGLLIVNWVDALIRPQIVSKKTKMNSAIALIGMVGGLFAFGILGLILGPLILAYLFLIIEFYREKKFKSLIFEETKKSEGYRGLYLINKK